MDPYTPSRSWSSLHDPKRNYSTLDTTRLHATVEQSLAFHARNKRERIFSDIRYLSYCPTLY
ncbi:hypothetical protein Taro_037313 [Colocasia esculenta]|uniref:Uncharacterized protein n=1 Tax=Colocasia esculenta TaxID=4460 RepID=A0A843W5D8_COLES|nr:hypothetical protein [Colocasia esculenta]